LVLAGDKTKAQTAYRDFLILWKEADTEIPVLSRPKPNTPGSVEVIGKQDIPADIAGSVLDAFPAMLRLRGRS
jgi:hypothetical protein